MPPSLASPGTSSMRAKSSPPSSATLNPTASRRSTPPSLSARASLILGFPSLTFLYLSFRGSESRFPSSLFTTSTADAGGSPPR
ncbi:hypothetical protein EE612_047658 [Oryza sativa]|nr:hypothetical protein EE612_047658 [Oryza sativa]